MSDGSPLLNDYKSEFVWKRIPQTLFGGLKLRLGYDAPAYVYLNQIVLWLLPWLFGGVFTLLVELNVIHYTIGMYVYGALMTIYVIVVNIITLVVQTKSSAISPLSNTNNLLADDDEIDFTSCCGVQTFEFVVPGKKYKINIVLHGLLSGPLCALGFWYLLPQTLSGLYGSVAGTVILYILGWITLLIAQYSLTVGAPPETAVFRTLDNYELTPLMRPFYVYLFLAIDLLARYYPEFLVTNQVLHIVFVFLPLLWMLGILPPLDACFFWIFEQSLVLLFGGTPMASDIRLMTMLVLSVGVYLAVYFVPLGTATIAIMSSMGYILSTDLGGLGSQLLNICSKQKNTQDETLSISTSFLWRWTWKEVLFHVAMTTVATGVAIVIHVYINNITSDIVQVIGYTIVGVLVIQKLLCSLQSVYVGCGLVRNKLYPASVERKTIFKKAKKRLKALGYTNRVILDIVSPALLVAYVTMIGGIPELGGVVVTPLTPLAVMGLMRTYRAAWQCTPQCLLDLTIYTIASLAFPSDVTWVAMETGIKLLIVAIARDRILQFLDKIYFYFVLFITSWSDKKQRRKSTVPMMVISILLFPFILIVIATATVMAAPLLPLFTLPVFLIGYPRPIRSWPGVVGSSANVNPDTVYYKQFAPSITKALREAFANGSLGDPTVGKHFLMRFQDRMAWVMILERGYSYCTINIKGLELQETSCHTVEAGRLDDMFDTTFDQEGGIFNKYPANVLTPTDAAYVNTYSDAKNVLTGIIDSPDLLAMMKSSFLKCFIWELLHHNVKAKSQGKLSTPRPATKAQSRTNIPGIGEHETFSPRTDKSRTDGTRTQSWQSIQVRPAPVSVNNSSVNDNTNARKNNNAANELPPLEDDWPESRPSTAGSHRNRPMSAKSFASSVWSDDNDSLMMAPIGNKNKVNLTEAMNKKQHTSSPLKASAQDSGRGQSSELPGSIMDVKDDYDPFDDMAFGLPVIDINASHKPSPNPLFNKTPASQNQYKPITNLAGSMQFSSPYSSKLSLPLKWRELPMDQDTINKHLELFPKEWYHHVLKCLDLEVNGKSSEEVAAELQDDEILTGIYAQLTMACYAVINVLGVAGSDVVDMGPYHVYKLYTGEIPWSQASEWISEDDDLKTLVVKAYRHAVKLSIDQVLLGEASDHAELQEYMDEYERDWYIGSETDPRWGEAVLKNKPQLFSLGHNPVQGTYTSRTLSSRDVEVYIGRLNPEVVRGMWANVNLELLYMTNDDEERYSIQAHSTVLRNLNVQSADPPLGYPIYSSPPISVPTF
ncbi:unnamed protein product [Owenia fusiformis]|uniref:Pecanex-like protein n=1 Tax=Owenia fusiformis TaxID=6347 RepID=A0A8J1U4B9_OWEFU|nr:unnamed protein product [Owenia fusiformis]